MYKTKLQELCHQKTWNLPEYSTIKEGLDHNPSFHATVTVNGLSFSSLSPAKSSKLAQNDAAKSAFDHFSDSSVTAPVSNTTVTTPNNDACGGEVLHLNQNPNPNPQVNQPAASAAVAIHNDKFADGQHLYKNLLQIYAQKRSLTLPIYSCEREGPPHASRFRCKVTIDQKTYESPDFFTTLSKAEHAAAKVALMSLTPDGVDEDESAYKNLLQEFAQKEGFCLPSYNTIMLGESHKPTFASTVEVEGESFTGQETKTKKQAELSAAKVAYKALKQRKSSQSPSTSSFRYTNHHTLNSSSGKLDQNLIASSSNLRQRPITQLGKPSESAQSLSPPHQRQKVVQCNSGSSSSSRSNFMAFKQDAQPWMPGCDKQAEDDKAVADVSVSSPARSANSISCYPKIASLGPESSSATNILSSTYSSIPSLPEHGLTSSSLPINSSTNLAVSSNIEHPTGANLSHQHNKVIVHPRETNMTYPSGSTMLSMSDDKWVAVRTPQSSQ